MSYASTSGFGAISAMPSGTPYSDIVNKAVSSALSNTTIQSEISPGARAALGLTATALQSAQSGALGAGGTDALVNLALTTAGKLLGQIGSELGIQLGGTVASSIVQVIPWVGGVVSALASAPWAKGTGCSASDAKHFCNLLDPKGWILGPNENKGYGTGPNGDYLPVDLLVNYKVVYPNTTTDIRTGAKVSKYTRTAVAPTELGKAIRLSTETHGESEATKYLGSTGLPIDRQRIYKQLREAIQNTWKQPGTDGGVALWLLYLDMIRSDLQSKRLTPKLMRYLTILRGAAMSPGEELYDYFAFDGQDTKGAQDRRDVARVYIAPRSWAEGKGSGLGPAQWYAGQLLDDCRYGLECALWNSSGIDGIQKLVDIWTQTLHPFYYQFPPLDQVIAKAKALLGPAPQKTPSAAQIKAIATILTAPAPLKVAPTQKLASTTPQVGSKMSPVAAIAIGMGVAAVGAAVLLPAPKRR